MPFNRIKLDSHEFHKSAIAYLSSIAVVCAGCGHSNNNVSDGIHASPDSDVMRGVASNQSQEHSKAAMERSKAEEQICAALVNGCLRETGRLKQDKKTVVLVSTSAPVRQIAKEVDRSIFDEEVQELIDRFAQANLQSRSWTKTEVPDATLMDEPELQTLVSNGQWQNFQRQIPAAVGFARMSRAGLSANLQKAVVWWEYHPTNTPSARCRLLLLQKYHDGWRVTSTLVWVNH